MRARSQLIISALPPPPLQEKSISRHSRDFSCVTADSYGNYRFLRDVSPDDNAVRRYGTGS